MIVLKPGIEGNRALGTHSISGLYIKFQDGVVDIKDDSIVELLRNHPSYDFDFVEVKEKETDPYSDTRVNMEPAHVTTEIIYGHAGKKEGTAKANMSPQLKKMIQDEAIKMIPEFLKANPGILKDILSDLVKPAKEEEEKEDTIIPTTNELPDLEEVTKDSEEEMEISPGQGPAKVSTGITPLTTVKKNKSKK